VDPRLEAFADRLLQPDLIAGDWPADLHVVPGEYLGPVPRIGLFPIDVAPSRMKVAYTAGEARAGEALPPLEGVGVSP